MANYAADFSGDTLSSPPAGWTQRFVSTGSPNWRVLEAAGFGATGRGTRFSSTSTGRRLMSLNALDADADRDEIDVLCRMRVADASQNQVQGGLYVRASGSAGSETGYRAWLQNGQVVLNRLSGGTSTQIGAAASGISGNAWCYMRLRAHGTTISVKVWPVTDIEPVGWTISVTDSGVSGVGWAGMHAFHTSNQDWDAVAFGTDGDTAELPALPDADGRTTQALMQTVTHQEAEGRSTQFLCYTIGIQGVPGRTTQAFCYTIGRVNVPGRTTQLLTLTVGRHLVPCATRWAQCWIIRRIDGVVLGFTSLDRPILVDGVLCHACKSLNGGAMELAAPMGSIGNQDVTGLIDDDAISEKDLYAGLYDDATVEIWLAPWEPDPDDRSRPRVAAGQTVRRLARGRTGKVSSGDTVFTAEVLTDGARLEQTALVKSYTPGCRWVQYDGNCGLDYDTHKVIGSVTAQAAPSPHNKAARRVFFDDDRAEASGVFDGGLLIWTSGTNEGQRQEVKSFEASNGRFTLWDMTLAPIQIGDTYEVAPTCKNNVAGCKSFSNFVNYGGFPDVPGQDEIIKSPNAK